MLRLKFQKSTNIYLNVKQLTNQETNLKQNFDFWVFVIQ